MAKTWKTSFFSHFRMIFLYNIRYLDQMFSEFVAVLIIIWEQYKSIPWLCIGHTKLLRYPHNKSLIFRSFHSTLVCRPENEERLSRMSYGFKAYANGWAKMFSVWSLYFSPHINIETIAIFKFRTVKQSVTVCYEIPVSLQTIIKSNKYWKVKIQNTTIHKYQLCQSIWTWNDGEWIARVPISV